MTACFSIQDVLSARLSEAGWTDQVKSHAKGELSNVSRFGSLGKSSAMNLDILLTFILNLQNKQDRCSRSNSIHCSRTPRTLHSVRILAPLPLADLRSRLLIWHLTDTLPDTVKNDILAQIRAFVVSQINDSGEVSAHNRR
jgi:hypothetical protein